MVDFPDSFPVKKVDLSGSFHVKMIDPSNSFVVNEVAFDLPNSFLVKMD
jgi:hypothetical protein